MWVAVAKPKDLAPETACAVRGGGRDLALVCAADGFFALDNSCPHSGGPLGEGLVQGRTITCPLHGWQFDTHTGRCLTEKRPDQCTYPVRIEGDQVFVELPDPAEKTSEGPEAEWTAVLEGNELQPGMVRRVQAAGISLALLCTAEGLFAMDNSCPHEGGPLGEGSLDGTTVTCPLHGWKFDARTGECLTAMRYKQRTFETKIEKGTVWVRVAPTAPTASASVDLAKNKSPVEVWKQAKHGIDVWPDVLRYAREKTPMLKIEEADLERMKWYGYFHRKNNDQDHYMCRVRIPGCEMTTDQAQAIAYVARESGYSIVDVTSRGNIQIQGLTIDKLPAVRAALERVGLTSRQSGHDNVRNITSHPWSGIDPEELIDTRELALQIQAMIIGHREFSDLPRKMNVALSGRSVPSAHAWTQDICYVAAQASAGDVGFQLLLGGNQGQSPNLAWQIPVLVRPDRVLGVTAAILRTFREMGSRHNRHQVRLRYLIERIGPDGALLEIEKRLDYGLERFPRPVARPTREESFVGWFKQKQDDVWALGVCVPVGRLTAEEFAGLAMVAREHGSGAVRTTYDQNLVIPGIPTSAKEEAAYAVARHGLTFEPDPAARNIVACTGKQFCNIAVTETKGYAYQLIEELRRRRTQLHGIHIHMSGCPSSCAMSHTADIGLKGAKIRRGARVLDAFDLYVGGGLGKDVQMGTLFRRGVPVSELPEAIETLVREFYLGRSAGETFSQFWRNKLKDHKAEPISAEVPRWLCTRCRHLHVAQDPPPFCPVCAAIRSKFEPAVEDAALEAPAPTAVPAPSGPVSWLCRSCGLKHVGDAPPEFCSVCGAKNTDFQRDNGASATMRGATKSRPGGKRILIVGGGIGGHTAAETARALDPDVQITLVTDERYSFYNRLNLTRFLAEEVQRQELFDYGPAWYEENQVEVLTESRVIGVDPIHKAALLAEGRELSYDACILTNGSAPFTPPFYREDLPRVSLLRTLDNVEGILSQTRVGGRVVVIGGGVLGLETAYGVKKRGADVQVFECLPYLMPRQLDKAAAALLMHLLREKGIEAFVGVAVQELLGQDKVEGLTLADGRRFNGDLVIISTGIKPNVDWLKRSGIRCNRGVIVDDRMQTSAPDVYAAGDVVEWQGQVVGLWTNAIEQAKVAATNAIGKGGFFQGFFPVTLLKCLGIPLISMGEVLEDGDGITSSVALGPGTYRRVIFRRGLPIGGILLGTSSGMGELRNLIERGLELETLRRRVVPDEVMACAP
jgi:ferredoxin-nitrite reductase